MNSQSITKNYIYSTVYQGITFFIPIITTPYLARVFGVEKVGIFSYTNSLASYFILLGTLGTSVYGQREIACTRDDKGKLSYTFWEIELLKILSTGTAVLGWLLYIHFSKQYQVYYICFIVYIIASAFDISWFFQGIENFKIVVIRNLIVKLAGVIALFLFIKSSTQLRLYIFILGLAELSGNLSMWSSLSKYLAAVDIREIKIFRHLKDVIVYFIPTIATSVYTVLDKTMIGWLTDDMAESGYYEQANKIIGMAKALCDSFFLVMTTRMSYLCTHLLRRQMKDYFMKATQYCSFISILMTGGVIGLAHNMVPWYLGSGYEKVEILLYVEAILVVVLGGVSGVTGRLYLTPSGQRGRSSKAVIAGAVLNVVLNCILIPRWGSIGAALASVFAEMLVMGIYVYMSRDFVHWKEIWHCMWKKILAAIIMVLILVSFNFYGNIAISFIQAAIGFFVYVTMLFLLKDDSLTMIVNMLQAKVPFLNNASDELKRMKDNEK